MAALTQKQENFCAAYVETGNASEAYRRAYDASRMKQESISVKASELMRNGSVTVRIKELQAQAQKRHQLTVDDLINELEDARQIAMGGERPTPAAMVAATLGKAKLLGLDCPSMALDLESKRLALEKLQLELDALKGKDKATGTGQDRPQEYRIAPDEPVPDEPIL